MDSADPTSQMLDVSAVDQRYHEVVRHILKILQDHKSLQDIIVLFDIDELSENDELTVVRVCNVKRFLSKCLFVAEMFTGIPGRFVDLETTILDIEEVLSGKCDDTPEIAFDMVGDWMDANTHRYLCLNIWKVLMIVCAD